MRFLPGFALLALVTATPAVAQNIDSLRADSAFRRGDWSTVATLYSTATKRTPTSGLAWLRLGFARHALGEVDSAIVAFERARTLEWQVPIASYRLARLYSLKGNLDKAFENLDRIVPLQLVPRAVLDTVTDLAAARRDPRYQGVTSRLDSLRFPCHTRDETRQFDFWIGDWNVTPWQQPPGPNLTLLGTNHVESILEHCVLLENWTSSSPGGGSGKSMNYFDTNRNQWRQVWVADGGGSLDYAGTFADGAMRFEGWTLGPKAPLAVTNPLSPLVVYRGDDCEQS